MKFISLAKKIADNFKASDKVTGSKADKLMKILSRVAFISPIIFPLVLIFIVFIVISSMFGEKLSLLQMVDPNNYEGYNVGVSVFDTAALEEYYNLSTSAYETTNNASTDLAQTDYKSIANFNDHIKKNVCAAGYGTREGVVAAGMSLVGDYIKATGKRIRYSQSGRQDPASEGIVDNVYMDCSGFAMWSLYNGGFNIPCGAETGSIYSWASSSGYIKSSSGGIAGDFLITNGKGHIMLIVGTYDDGYYTAEAFNYGVGVGISKRSFSSLSGYSLIDMTSYYSNPSNVRGSGSC